MSLLRRRCHAWFRYQVPMRPLAKHVAYLLLFSPVGSSFQSLRAMRLKGQVKVGGAWWPKELAAPVPYPEQIPSQPSRTDTPGKQRPEASSEVSPALPVMMLPPGLPGHQGGLLLHLPAGPPKSVAKGKAKAAVSSSSQKVFSARARSAFRWWSKAWKSCSSIIGLLAVLAFWSGDEGPLTQVTSMLRSMANVTRAAGGAAVLLLETGTALTASANSAMVSVASSSLGAAQLAWHGVDVLDVRFNTSWLLEGSAGRTTGAQQDTLDSWSAQAASVSLGVPALSSRKERFDAAGRYHVADAAISWELSGHIVLKYLITETSFRTQWANPVWELLEWNCSAEASQISNTIKGTLAAFNDTVPHELIVELPQHCLKGRILRLIRFTYFCFRAILLEICAPRGGGLFWSSLGAAGIMVVLSTRQRARS